MDFKTLALLYHIDFPDRTLVMGEGDEHADIMLIGEAPGREEEEQGRPFVGKAGRNLSEFLEVLGLNRESLFISNAVKFRPTKLSERGTVSNRPPTEKEIAAYRPYLLKEIEMVSPKLLVTLGGTALRALLGNEAAVGKCHGNLCEFQGIPVFPLFHPASIIYNPELKSVYSEDLQKLKDLLEKGEILQKPEKGEQTLANRE